MARSWDGIYTLWIVSILWTGNFNSNLLAGLRRAQIYARPRFTFVFLLLHRSQLIGVRDFLDLAERPFGEDTPLQLFPFRPSVIVT